MAKLSIRYVKPFTAITIGLFFFFPLYSLPLVIIGMLKNQKWSFILWAIFMGLLGYLFPPYGDLYRYSEDAYYLENLPFNRFIDFTILKSDYFLSLFSYSVVKIGLSPDVVRFSYNFIGYLLLGYLYHDLIHTNSANIPKAKMWMFIVVFIGFNWTYFLYRFGLSAILCGYGSYKLIYKRSKSGWIFIIWAILNHLTYICFAVGLLCQQIGALKFKRLTVICIAILSLPLGTYLIDFLQLFSSEYVNRYMSYLDGYWASQYMEDSSWKFKFFSYYKIFIGYIAILIFLLIYSKKTLLVSKESFINYSIIITSVVSPFLTIYTRFMTVLLLFIKIFFISTFKNTILYQRCLKLLTVLIIVSIIMDIWSIRRPLAASNAQILAYAPVPLIFKDGGYSKKWIMRNINYDGNLTHE